MENGQQMGASARPVQQNDKTRQQSAEAAMPAQQSAQQSGGNSSQGQMQSTQFTDWASI